MQDKEKKKKKKKKPLLFSETEKHGVFEIDMLSLFLLFTKIDTDPCDPNPCGDNTGVHGTCSKLTTTDFKCDCDHRYIGTTCTGKSVILMRAATTLVCTVPVASLQPLPIALVSQLF